MNSPIENHFLNSMPAQEISIDVLLEKYAKSGESSIEEVQTRVAMALSTAEKTALSYPSAFFEAQQAGFIPAGRINSAAGMELRATLINCFVQPIGDSVTDDNGDKPSIYTALGEAAETMRRGGGVGYDFSQIRPKDALVKGTHSRASGPISFMKVFNASCSTVESAGARRGAQMGILRCDHPDIFDFVSAKAGGDLTNFNISIGVTDEFMRAVAENGSIDLVHTAEPIQSLKEAGAHQRADGKWVYSTIKANDLWNIVMKNTYDFAEPGIVFLTSMNRENNLYYAETIEACNPCGEQPLPDYGCCCLGSINLTRFVNKPFTQEAAFDYERFAALVPTSVRMLDNVLDVTAWPLERQKQEAMNKRRIGLGFLGLGSALVMLGIAYNSEHARQFAAKVSEVMRDAAYNASVDLAIEKGAFPLFDADKYLQGNFIKRLPQNIRDRIKAHGIRNSHLLSIAPTGTITLAFADNASNGIEPAFSWVYNRKKRMADNTIRNYEVADHAWRLYRHLGNDVSDESKLPKQFVTALQMSAEDHLRILEAVQPYIDSAISKTVNVPADYNFENFKELYMLAWRARLKGLATYRPNDVLGSVLSVPVPEKDTPNEVGKLDIDPLKKQYDSRPLGDLESVTSKVQYATFEGKKTVYLTVSFIKTHGILKGKPIIIERPFEFFMPAGQKNDGQQWISASMRLLSMAARSGGSIAKALADMREVVWDKGMVRCGTIEKEVGVKVPMHHESEVAAIGYALQRILIKRNFLDADGNQIPVHVLASNFEQEVTGEFSLDEGESDVTISNSPNPSYIKKPCPDCGGPLSKVDGCTRCSNCGYTGSCG